jgi:hypothetical protein
MAREVDEDQMTTDTKTATDTVFQLKLKLFLLIPKTETPPSKNNKPRVQIRIIGIDINKWTVLKVFAVKLEWTTFMQIIMSRV